MLKLAIILKKIGDELIGLALYGLVLLPFWFFYKVAQGVYHLLDKLIDKL